VAVLHRRLRSRQRGSTFVERHGSPSAGPSQRVLPVFIRALRKTFQPPLASLSASAPGVITTANRSAVALSQSLTTPFADPFAGLEDRNLRDAESYTEKTFPGQSYVCFIFFENYLFGFRTQKRWFFPHTSEENTKEKPRALLRPALPAPDESQAVLLRPLLRFGKDIAARKTLSAHLFGVAELHERAHAARSG